ncbi:WXG100 family type VII secretion target [Kitasatospora misakiensis]|uniref:WXG100 family type VII secretion target n=1 Tax=Kitasatospora misakiensis TaxID=67330 RepID=A0ABW0XA33_9ACTN
MGDIKVNPGEIRTSGAAARAIGGELKAPVEAAVAASHKAAGELTGWSIATRLDRLASGWAPALTTVRDRFTKTADNLDATAQAYNGNENAISSVWQKQGPM